MTTATGSGVDLAPAGAADARGELFALGRPLPAGPSPQALAGRPLRGIHSPGRLGRGPKTLAASIWAV